jgi:ABC-type lipoprotein release transport system permease subunit
VVAPARTRSLLFVLIAVLASLVSAVSVFAATTQWLMERQSDIVVRTILGASPRDITWMTIRGSLFTVSVGGVLGMYIAWVMAATVRAGLVVVDSAGVAMLPGVGMAVFVALGTTYVVTRRVTRSLSLRLS